MVVTCENCNTGFNLDENLIKESGSKVRCSKCRHIFTAHKPVPVEEPEPTPELEGTPKEALDFDLPEESEEKPAEDEIALEDLGLEEEPPAEEPTLAEDASAAQETADAIDDAPEEVLDLDLSEEPEEKPATEAAETEEAPEGQMAHAIPVASVEGAEQEETEEDEQLEEELMPPPPVEIEPQATKRISTPLMFVLLLVLLAGGAFAAFTLLKRFDVKIPFLESYLGAPESAIADPGNLRMTTLEQLVKTEFVENKTAGRLVVIKGKVRNDYPDVRKFIMVKGVLYSQGGKPVQEKTVYCGNILSESDLQTLDKATMHTRLRDRFGDKRSNFRIPSGKVIPFLVVFSDLPQDLGEFSVEVVSSASG